MKRLHSRVMPIIAIMLLAAFALTACSASDPRVEPAVTYSPGAPFSSNFNDPDPRRQIRCTIMFEVVDETAIAELDSVNYKVRNAVLIVLGELTMEEITTDRDLVSVADRIVQRVNAEVGATFGNYSEDNTINLVTKAYFTDFVIA